MDTRAARAAHRRTVQALFRHKVRAEEAGQWIAERVALARQGHELATDAFDVVADLLAAHCRVRPDGQPRKVGPDATCPADSYRCPQVYPYDGRAVCSACPCEARSVHTELLGTLYCPDDEDRAGCPCDQSGRECCLEIGRGLSCFEGLWSFFWDCPCGPVSFGCDPEHPALCSAASP